MVDDNVQGFTPQGAGGGLTIGGPILSGGQPPTGQNAHSISTLKKSELEAIILELLAGSPMLQPPHSNATNLQDLVSNALTGSVDATTALAALGSKWEQTKNDIISTMWDTYLAALHKKDDEKKAEYIKHWTEDINKGGPKSAAEYYAYLMSLPQTQKIDEISDPQNGALAAQFTAVNNWLIKPSETGNAIEPASNVTAGQASAGYPDSRFIVGALIVSQDVVREAIGATTQSISLNPVADALFALGPSSGLPMDSQSAVALVAALLNGGAVYKANSDTVEQAAKNNQLPQDVNFAINYAKNILAIVTHNVQEDQGTAPDEFSQNRLVRLLLSTMALSVLYRSVFHGLTNEERNDVIGGNTSSLPQEVRELFEQLTAEINSVLPQDPASREAMLGMVYSFVDQNRSVDSLFGTTRILKQLLTSGDIDQQRLEAKQT